MDDLQVFICYSHKDAKWFDEKNEHCLIPWLEDILRARGINLWYDRAGLKAGDQYRKELSAGIDHAQIALLLISWNFLSSEFILKHELPRIQAREDQHQMTVIPVLLSPCDWQQYPQIEKYQILPGQPTPLVSYIKDDADWEDAKHQILTAILGWAAKIRATAQIAKEGSVETPGPTTANGVPGGNAPKETSSDTKIYQEVQQGPTPLPDAPNRQRWIRYVAVGLMLAAALSLVIWRPWTKTVGEPRAAATPALVTGPAASPTQPALASATPTAPLTAAPTQSLAVTPPNAASTTTPAARVTATSPAGLIAKSAGLYDETSAYQFAWAPDGSTVAITGSGLYLYDVASRTGRRVNSESMGQIVFSTDGSTLFAAPYDGVRVWDVATWTKLNTLPGSKDVRAMVVSPDNTTLVASVGQALTFWDLASGAEPRTFPAGGYIQALAYSPDGRTVAADGGQLTLWDTIAGTVQAVIEGQTGSGSLAFSPDGRVLAAAADDGVRLWDVTAGRAQSVLAGHTGPVNSVAFSPDGALIATGGSDLTVRLWDAATGKQVQSITGHTAGVRGVAFSPDGTLLASGADDGLRLWQISAGASAASPTPIRATPPATLPPIPLAASAIAPENAGAVAQGGQYNETYANEFVWSPDGSTVVIGGGEFHVYDVAAGTGHRVKPETMGEVHFTPDGATLIAASYNGIALWDAASVTKLSTLPDSKNVGSCAISPDGSTLVAVTGEALKFWDLPSGVVLATIPANEHVAALAFSPDGHTLATGGSQLALWDVATGVKNRTYAGQTNVTDLAFSPDGKLLAVASDDGTRLWDLAAGRPVHLLAGHTGRVNSVAFSPGGLIIATAGEDQSVRLWQAATGKELASLTGHTSAVGRVAFAPDGATLASGGSINDGLRLWRVAP